MKHIEIVCTTVVKVVAAAGVAHDDEEWEKETIKGKTFI